jgi:hypothetical protein
MIRSALLITILAVLSSSPAFCAAAAGEMRPPTQEEKKFYSSVVLPAMLTVKTSMPPVPQGWVVENETPIASGLPGEIAGDASGLRFSYAITYTRVAGVEDEKKRLDEVHAEALKKHGDVAREQTDELAKKKAATADAMKKAAKKKKKKEEQRLKKELEVIEGRLRAIPAETEQAVSADVEDYIVRDRGITVRVTVNDTTAALADARYFSRPKAAYALKKEGGRVGPTGWKADELLLLYGDWDDAGKNVFRGKVDQTPFSSKVRTITVFIAGDRSRTEQFLKQMGMKDILGMLK